MNLSKEIMRMNIKESAGDVRARGEIEEQEERRRRARARVLEAVPLVGCHFFRSEDKARRAASVCRFAKHGISDTVRFCVGSCRSENPTCPETVIC